jgi:hypothetical protein
VGPLPAGRPFPLAGVAGLPLVPGLGVVPVIVFVFAGTVSVMWAPWRNRSFTLVMSWMTVVIHGSLRSADGALDGVHAGCGPA